MSLDPVIHSSESPYVTFYNNPIIFSDLFGTDPNGIPTAEAGPNISSIKPVEPNEVIVYQNTTWAWNNKKKLWECTYNRGMYDEYRNKLNDERNLGTGLLKFGIDLLSMAWESSKVMMVSGYGVSQGWQIGSNVYNDIKTKGVEAFVADKLKTVQGAEERFHLDFYNFVDDIYNGRWGNATHTLGYLAPQIALMFASGGASAEAKVASVTTDVVIAEEITVVNLAAKTGLSNAELVSQAAIRAENAVGGTGRFAGTAKHTYATTLLERYQGIYGSRGLEVNKYFNGQFGRGFLDVHDVTNGIIYDFKFGQPFMKASQFSKYSNTFGQPVNIVDRFGNIIPR